MEQETNSRPCATPHNLDHARSLDGQAIDAFLACGRVALVGVSRRDDHFSQTLLKELRKHGLDVVPVNPAFEDLKGERVYPSVSSIEPPVEAAYVATPPGASAEVVKECYEAGLTKIWLHKGGGGEGAASEAAIEYGRTNDMQVVAGQCILMFLEPVSWVHRAHKGLKKLAGTLPH